MWWLAVYCKFRVRRWLKHSSTLVRIHSADALCFQAKKGKDLQKIIIKNLVICLTPLWVSRSISQTPDWLLFCTTFKRNGPLVQMSDQFRITAWVQQWLPLTAQLHNNKPTKGHTHCMFMWKTIGNIHSTQLGNPNMELNVAVLSHQQHYNESVVFKIITPIRTPTLKICIYPFYHYCYLWI